MTRQRNKEIKSYEDNETRLKEKQRKLQMLKSKMAELAKLVGSEKEEKPAERRRESAIEEQEGEYEAVVINGKKVYKSKDS